MQPILNDSLAENNSIPYRLNQSLTPYCFCRGPDYGGKMVCCDNLGCKWKWFHFECVHLTDPPRGRWYCRDCKSLGFKAQGRPRKDDQHE